MPRAAKKKATKKKVTKKKTTRKKATTRKKKVVRKKARKKATTRATAEPKEARRFIIFPDGIEREIGKTPRRYLCKNRCGEHVYTRGSECFRCVLAELNVEERQRRNEYRSRQREIDAHYEAEMDRIARDHELAMQRIADDHDDNVAVAIGAGVVGFGLAAIIGSIISSK